MAFALCLFLALAAAGNEQWLTRETPHFKVLYLARSEGAADAIVPRLEPELTRVAGLLRTDAPELITVVFAPDQKTFISLHGGAVPRWASGTAHPAKSMIHLRPLTGAEVRHDSMRAVIAHEISHVLLYNKLNRNFCPQWLDEGIAVYVSAEPLTARADRLFPIGLTGRAIPFRQLEGGFPHDAASASRAYAQSGDFVRWIFANYGADAFDEYLEGIAAGVDHDEALHAAFSKTLFDLELEWMEHVRWVYGLIPQLSGGALLWFLISLLAIYAILKKRSRSRKKLELMRLEEGYVDTVATDVDYGYEEEDDDEPPFRGLH